MVVVSVGLLFLSQDLAYLFSKLEEVNMAQGWPLFPSQSLVVSLFQAIVSLCEPLISSLWLQHHAFNLRPRIQTKILMSCFQGPRLEFQFQVHGVVSCRPTPLFVICDLFQAMAWVLLGGPCKLELL